MPLPLPPCWTRMQDNPYFGPAAPEGKRKGPRPIGAWRCVWCKEAFTEEDHGFWTGRFKDSPLPGDPIHLECFIRSAVGSAAHQERRCSCSLPFGDCDAEGPELGKHQHAVEAYLVWYKRATARTQPSEN